MIDWIKKHRLTISFVGELLFSILTFPTGFSFLLKWVKVPYSDEVNALLGGMYAVMGMGRLCRALRLWEANRPVAVGQLIYGVALAGCGALAVTVGYTQATHPVFVLVYWGGILLGRIIDLARNRKIPFIVLNGIVILLMIMMMVGAGELYSMTVIVMVATLSALISIMVGIFSRIRLDILKQIIRKTYALEIIGGLVTLMVAFSSVLVYVDESFNSFWQGLWYCFAVVTTIGFGDVTPTSAIGKTLTAILGVYGIVVVALVTSIIVNFYGEMKRTDETPEKEG